MFRIGLIGCGAIGTFIAEAIDKGKINNSELISIFDVLQKNMDDLVKKLRNKPAIYSDFDDFLDKSDLDIVIEAASQEAVRNYGERVVGAGVNIMIMSVGALLDKKLYKKIRNIAKEKGCRIIIPSGAIGGLDIIKAAMLLSLKKVTLTTIKNPVALLGSPTFQENQGNKDLSHPRIIFEGPAIEAVKAFPSNVNVSATLSLAGIGGDRTIVRIIADPSIISNIHEIEVEGDFGKMKISLENITHPSNPKTSYLAVLSAIEKLKEITSNDINIGT